MNKAVATRAARGLRRQGRERSREAARRERAGAHDQGEGSRAVARLSRRVSAARGARRMRRPTSLRWQNTRAFLAKLSDARGGARSGARASRRAAPPRGGALARFASAREVPRQDRRRCGARGSAAKPRSASSASSTSGRCGAPSSGGEAPGTARALNLVTDSHRSAGCMDLSTSLPADLAALADPSARGAAPLLRPPDAAGESPRACGAVRAVPRAADGAVAAAAKPCRPPARNCRSRRSSLAAESAASATDALLVRRQADLPPRVAAAACDPSTGPSAARPACARRAPRGAADDAAAIAQPAVAGQRAVRDPLAARPGADRSTRSRLARARARQAEPRRSTAAADVAASTPAKTAAAPGWLERLCRTALAAARGADAERVARRRCAGSAGSAGAASFAQSQ